MCKIGILFENRDFEHDVYELIKAFYPEAEIHTLYENAEAEYDLRFSVEWDYVKAASASRQRRLFLGQSVTKSLLF